MPKLTFNQQNEIDAPTIILQNRNFDTIGKINHVDSIVYTEHFNGANEVSFTVHKRKDGEITPYWEEITDHKVVYIPEFQSRFYMKVSVDEGNDIEKKCVLKSLCEGELSQIILRNIEINTDNDILREDYDSKFPTVFYRNPEDWENYDWSGYHNYSPEMKKKILKSSSLLHRLLEDKAPHYTIHTVADSLCHIQRSFSISETDIYSELVGEISEQFHCIFQFNSLNREIDVYDLYNVGEDTTVFISRNNLASSISLETNADSMKNCFYVEGGDDVMNSAIRSVNPNGSQYIFRNSAAMKHDMPQELVNKLEEYDKTYQDYAENHIYHINNNIVKAYNDVVSFVKKWFPDNVCPELSSEIHGYSNLTNALYHAVDLYDFINDSMLPTLDTDGLGISDSLNSIVEGFASGLDGKYKNMMVLSSPQTATQTTVENTIKNDAKLYYSPAYYDISLTTVSYKKATNDLDGKWKGKITLTSLTETDENGKYKSETTKDLTLTIPKSRSEYYEKYVNQKIHQAISGKDALSEKQITSMSLSDEDFLKQLHLYSLAELNHIKNICQTCLDIIDSMQLNGKEETKTLHDTYHNFYYDRIYGKPDDPKKDDTKKYCIDTEIELREAQIKAIKEVYYYDYLTMDEPCGVIYGLRKNTQDALDIKSYLGDLYHTFCSYRREDKYSNSNYISDGLTNAEIVENAKKLLQAASDELYKLSNPQYTISTEMNNLLALDEFKPLKDSFSVGNWIRMEIDDQIYKLRLLSYQITFDDLQSIQVEFSTAEKTATGYNDIQDIISSASSMASSYDSVVHQVDKSAHSNAIINHWVQNGLNATNTKFANNDKQEVLMDEHGILLRKIDGEIEGQYEPYQLKFLSNGLYFTSDAWRNVDVGIGRIHYTDIDNNTVDTVGVIAKKVVGDLIAGEELRIYNTDGNVVINGDGITLDGGKITWKNNKLPEDAVNGLTDFKTSVSDCLGTTTITGESVISPRIGGGYLYISDGKNGSVTIDPTQSKEKTGGYIFAVKNPEGNVVVGVNTKGEASFSGSITASSITGSSIKVEEANGDDSFEVTNTGKLTAKNVTLTGNCTAENFRVRDNIYFYLSSEDSSKYTKMISLEPDEDSGDFWHSYYNLVIGKANGTTLLEDQTSSQRFNLVVIKGDMNVKEHLSAKELSIGNSCMLSNATYIRSAINNEKLQHISEACSILGLSSENNLHLGRGLYESGNPDLKSNTYISAHDNMYLRSQASNGHIRFNIDDDNRILDIASDNVVSSVPITAPEIKVEDMSISAEIANLKLEIASLRAELNVIKQQLSNIESSN
ncbi:MAG: hypothetical protein NC124_18140 [Clostridium sp.]|nr:hypothetical protein [Clostridium sp.]